jgi:hypothetical protein
MGEIKKPKINQKGVNERGSRSWEWKDCSWEKRRSEPKRLLSDHGMSLPQKVTIPDNDKALYNADQNNIMT